MSNSLEALALIVAIAGLKHQLHCQLANMTNCDIDCQGNVCFQLSISLVFKLKRIIAQIHKYTELCNNILQDQDNEQIILGNILLARFKTFI